jgi:hypothetical protein
MAYLKIRQADTSHTSESLRETRLAYKAAMRRSRANGSEKLQVTAVA